MIKKTLFVASFCLASAGLAIELSSASSQAETRIVAQQPASNVSTPAANSKPPQIELLNPGAEPRQQLRFKPAIQCHGNNSYDRKNGYGNIRLRSAFACG